MGETTRTRQHRDEGAAPASGPSSAPPSERLKSLLERVSLVMKPGGGGATLLYTLGRIASSSRWLEDPFCVEITGDERSSTLEVSVETNDGERECIVPKTTFDIAFDELVADLVENPSLVGSLRVHVDVGEGPRRLSLTPRESGIRYSGDTRTPDPSRSDF